jgi:hypothetical protein
VDKTSLAVPTFVTVTVTVPLVIPTFTEPKSTEVGEKDSAGTATAVPVPVRLTLSGLLAALVVNVKLAVLAPVEVGEKTTLIEHEDAAAKVPAQVLPLVLNWFRFTPVSAMLVIVSVALPGLVSVTVWFPLEVPCVWLPKAMLVGLRDTVAAVPVPTSGAVALTVPISVNVALRTPVADGVKVRLTVHEELAAIVPPFAHVPVPALAKFEAFVPVMLK